MVTSLPSCFTLKMGVVEVLAMWLFICFLIWNNHSVKSMLWYWQTLYKRCLYSALCWLLLIIWNANKRIVISRSVFICIPGHSIQESKAPWGIQAILTYPQNKHVAFLDAIRKLIFSWMNPLHIGLKSHLLKGEDKNFFFCLSCDIAVFGKLHGLHSVQGKAK